MVLATATLAACGGGTSGVLSTQLKAASSAAPVAVASPVQMPSPSPAEPPSPSPTQAPAPTQVPAPVAVAAPPPPIQMAHATSRSFPLVAVGDGGARGSVTVVTQSGRATITVMADGLPPGTVHSVHLHFGNCPSAGSHILVLGTLRADASGSGSMTSNVNAVFSGPGHFVIIYVGPSAGLLGACANLG